MRKWKRKINDETAKMSIVREYIETGLPASDIASKYGLSGPIVLYAWVDKYLSRKDFLSLEPETDNPTEMAKKTKQQLEDELKKAKEENRRLKEALELEKLRSRAFDTMIDVAEKNFNIPIRKKAGTKQ